MHPDFNTELDISIEYETCLKDTSNEPVITIPWKVQSFLDIIT